MAAAAEAPQQPAANVFNIILTQSLSGNLLRLVEHRFQRPLGAPEAAAITAAFKEGLSSFQMGGTLSEFQAGGAELLELNMNVTIANKNATWLWACVVEATDGPVASISVLAGAITEGCKKKISYGTVPPVRCPQPHHCASPSPFYLLQAARCFFSEHT